MRPRTTDADSVAPARPGTGRPAAPRVTSPRAHSPRVDRQFVRQLLVDEAFAYGFTIAFWGSGVLLIDAFGIPGVQGVFAYAAGTVSGFGALAVATFGGPIQTVEHDTAPEYLVLTAIHYLSALVPIGATHLLVTAGLGELVTLFLAGAAVSVGYNISATLEKALSEALRRVERRVGDGS